MTIPFVSTTLSVLNPVLSLHFWFLISTGVIAFIVFTPAITVFSRGMLVRDLKISKQQNRDLIRLATATHDKVNNPEQEAQETIKPPNPIIAKLSAWSALIANIIAVIIAASVIRWSAVIGLNWGFLAKAPAFWTILLSIMLFALVWFTGYMSIGWIALAIGATTYLLPHPATYGIIHDLKQAVSDYETMQLGKNFLLGMFGIEQGSLIDFAVSNWAGIEEGADAEDALSSMYQLVLKLKLLAIALATGGSFIIIWQAGSIADDYLTGQKILDRYFGRKNWKEELSPTLKQAGVKTKDTWQTHLSPALQKATKTTAIESKRMWKEEFNPLLKDSTKRAKNIWQTTIKPKLITTKDKLGKWWEEKTKPRDY